MSGIAAETTTMYAAVKFLQQQCVNAVADLESKFGKFAASVNPTDWSTVPSCQAYGESYVSALAVYDAAIKGMHADIAKYTQTLYNIAKSMDDSDATSADRFNATIAKLDDGTLANTSAGRAEYYHHQHGELHSDSPHAAPDSTPDGDTGAAASTSTAPTSTTAPATTGGGGFRKE